MNLNFEDSLGYELQHQWFHIGVLFSGSAFKIEIYLLLINVKHREWQNPNKQYKKPRNWYSMYCKFLINARNKYSRKTTRSLSCEF